ncbi:putative aB1gp47 [Acinetobacter sp. 25977_6]|uniref:hypothetical protein n=1 Tax=unclassified Acinetobacter calcoaceticus/baumannii complex TaxID=2881046 RepID=UPI00044C4BF5|nr:MULTISPECIES: hypothetical protein [unclassified Acinetobacter calcoaceticus/baumannii complex]KCZ27906.1 putative aB1gp47 [Acinetobacter baumannii 25977_9]EXT33370.1 putative aB1gp47 [Acinetobacter sp. 25977_8]EXT38456.1 putative aB1gp47 [Acinetobacter sp. 25977_7]EXT39149.1 putative aB1gp47 [Acinetobacter sp. 25977_6]EXT43668.1 putative aB1gp47 [Acinetobacter sp. 25977_4]
MDNYKIKVTDEAESKEAQELFFELGYEWRDSKRDITNLDVVFIYAKDGVLTAGFNDHNFAEAGHKELTLPQLRDLVVLKRNDVKDANYRSKSVLDGFYFKSSDGVFYFMLDGKWVRSTTNTDEGLEPIAKDPALISGDVALANVHKCIVQYLHDDEPYGRWTTITDHLWSQYHLGMFLDPDTKFKFRFKPQTIKLELELPKPFEPRDGDDCFIVDSEQEDGFYRFEPYRVCRRLFYLS